MNKTNKTSASDFFQLAKLAKGAVMIGAAKARETMSNVKKALNMELGDVLLNTYSSFVSQGCTPDEAKKMTLKLASRQLDEKIRSQSLPKENFSELLEQALEHRKQKEKTP